MRMFTGANNNRVALSKNLDGAVAMIYGKARAAPGTGAVRQGGETVEVEIAVTRIYAMKPKVG